MLTTLVLLVGVGCLFVLAVMFSTLVTDAIRNGVPVSRLGVFMAATRHGYIDVGDDSLSDEASAPSATRVEERLEEPAIV